MLLHYSLNCELVSLLIIATIIIMVRPLKDTLCIQLQVIILKIYFTCREGILYKNKTLNILSMTLNKIK